MDIAYTFHLSLYASILIYPVAWCTFCCLVNTSVIVRYAGIQAFIRVPRFWQWSQLVYNRDAMCNDNRSTHHWQFTLRRNITTRSVWLLIREVCHVRRFNLQIFIYTFHTAFLMFDTCTADQELFPSVQNNRHTSV